MADRYLDFDVTLAGDASVTTDSTQGLVINAIGTDKSGSLTPNISGNDVGAIRTEIANIHTDNTNKQGMLMLGDLFYYVPPDTTLTFDGASGDNVRLMGTRLDGVSGRFDGDSSNETRFAKQGSEQWTFTQGTFQNSGDLSDGQEETVHTLTPNTDERYEFAGLQEMSLANMSTTEAVGQLNVFWDVDGQRYPSQYGDDSLAGVDIEYMPRPPSDGSEAVGFMWGAGGDQIKPLHLMGDETLQVKVRNVSGGTLSAAASGIDFTYTAAVRYFEGV